MTVAKLGEVFLSAHGPIDWTLQGGVHPNRILIELTVEEAKRVRPGVPTVLTLGSETFHDVYPLSIRPTDSPHTAFVEVMDLRWVWPNKHIEKDFNVTRRTGNVTLLGSREEIAQAKPEQRYMPHSLRNEAVPWTAQAVLDWLLKQLPIPNGIYVVPSQADFPTVEIQDLFLNEPAHHALQRVLQHIPGAQVRVNPTGSVEIYFEHDQSEQDELNGLLVEVGEDYPRLVDLRHRSPVAYNVYFQCEQELRLDYAAGDNDEEEGATFARLTPQHAENLQLENVIPFQDPSGVIPASAIRKARTVGRGTWVSITEFLAYLSTQERPPAAPVLTQQLLRKHFLSNFSRLAQLYVIPTGDPDTLWAQRLHALAQHWRQTFRLVPAWRDRLLALYPHRVAVWDRETAQRAISLVHCNYLVRPSWRGFTVRRSQRRDQGWSVEAYAEGLNDADVAPFALSLIDPELMIFHIAPQVDAWHEADSVAPGTSTQIPSLSPSDLKEQQAAYRALWEWVELSISWKLSTVLTGVRATPNDLGRLYRVRIEASGLAKRFPAARHKAAAQGPELDIRVLPGLMTAKFRWEDSEGDRIRASFNPREAAFVDLSSLLLNRDQVEDVAQAMASRIYELHLTRVEGTFRTKMRDIRPTGSLTSVTHRLDTNGAMSSICTASLPVTPRDLWPFLGDSTRKAINQILYQQ